MLEAALTSPAAYPRDFGRCFIAVSALEGLLNLLATSADQGTAPRKAGEPLVLRYLRSWWPNPGPSASEGWEREVISWKGESWVS